MLLKNNNECYLLRVNSLLRLNNVFLKKDCREFQVKHIKMNAGFTLVEILAAFAVVAILSGVILQMYIVSSKANIKAYEVDKINSIAVESSEILQNSIITSESDLEELLKQIYGQHDKVEITERSNAAVFKVYFDGEGNIINCNNKNDAAFYLELYIDDANEPQNTNEPSQAALGVGRNVEPVMACILEVDISNDIAGGAYRVSFERDTGGEYYAKVAKSIGTEIREDGNEQYIWDASKEIVYKADVNAFLGKVVPMKLIIKGFGTLMQTVGENAVSPVKFITCNNTSQTGQGLELSVYIADDDNTKNTKFKETVKIEPASGIVSYSFMGEYGIMKNTNKIINLKIFNTKAKKNVPVFETQIVKRNEIFVQ